MAIKLYYIAKSRIDISSATLVSVKVASYDYDYYYCYFYCHWRYWRNYKVNSWTRPLVALRVCVIYSSSFVYFKFQFKSNQTTTTIRYTQLLGFRVEFIRKLQVAIWLADLSTAARRTEGSGWPLRSRSWPLVVLGKRLSERASERAYRQPLVRYAAHFIYTLRRSIFSSAWEDWASKW